MKAFVIKFNDGYYWCGYNNSDKQLRKAVLYKSIKMAEETAKDCMTRVEYIRPYDNKIVSYEIIEITIAEGNLEQQLAEKDKEIKRLDNKPIIETNRAMGTMKIDDIEFTKEQVKRLNHLLEAFEKKIRKDVCDEIRNLSAIDVINKIYIVDIEILDQIEQGEQV